MHLIKDENGNLLTHGHEHTHEHTHAYSHEHDHDHGQDGAHAHTHSHEYTHTHEHSHEHGHEEEHTHEHDHAHAHDHAHDHGHTHEHGHTHDHGHSHCSSDCGSCSSGCDPKKEAQALLTYMLQHNEHHAAELDQMAANLEKLGLADSAKQIREGVSDFQKGNMRLSLALTLMKDQI